MLWNFQSNGTSLIKGLMAGLEDNSLLQELYNTAERTDFVAMSNDRHGRILYLPEVDKFWEPKHSSRADLPNMQFGINENSGTIVSGIDATETTIESNFVLLKRAPYGARKALKEYFGQK